MDNIQEKMDLAETVTPESLAMKLFSKDAGTPCSNHILPYSAKTDNDTCSFMFEILLTIYLEGLMNILSVIKQNNDDNDDNNENDIDIDSKIYKNITINDLRFPEPWFKSIGFTINIREYTDKININKIKSLSYCRILLWVEQKDKFYFLTNKVDKKYTFLLNRGYKMVNRIEKIYAILNKDDKLYQISFEQIFN